MAVDYSIITRVPNIGSRLLASQAARREENVRNQLLARQNLQFEQAQEDRRRALQREQQQDAAYEQIAGVLRQAGQDPDNPAVLQQLTAEAFKSRNPQVISAVSLMTERAAKRRQAAEERARVAAIMGGQPPGAPPAAAAAAAPLTRPADQLPITATSYDEGRGGRPEVPYGAQAMPVTPAPQAAAPRELPAPRVMVGAPPAANALAPATAAAAPVNAMTTPAANPRLAAIETEIDVKERQRAALLNDGSPDAMKQAAALQADLGRLDREYQRLQPKQQARSEFFQLQEELSSLPPGDPRRKNVEARMAKLTEPSKGLEVKLPPQQTKEQEARGGFLVEQYKDVSKTATAARKTLVALDTQANILDKGFKTGFGTDAQKAGASLLAALGVPEAKKFATDAQTFLSAAQRVVLDRQIEQKGPQTDQDAIRIEQTGAQLGNTTEANRFIVDVAKAQAKLDIKRLDFYDDWWEKNKTYDGAQKAWLSGEGGKSLFDLPELKKYAAPAAAPATAPAAAQTPAGAGPYSDPDKERRYQEWKRSQGMK
jgi:hypothetical protein